MASSFKFFLRFLSIAVIFCSGILLSSALSFAATDRFDHSLLDEILKKNVNSFGDVDYEVIQKSPQSLRYYLQSLMAVPSLERDSWGREEQLAFWLNAYHAILIDLVIENYPIKSVSNVAGFWDLAIFRTNGEDDESYSLNDIREKKLLGIYRDEKIHLALSQGANSGPLFPREAFTASKVEGQLFNLTRKFVNDAREVEIDISSKRVKLSKIFKWYGQDFKLDFGTPEPIGNFSSTETAILRFLAYYLEDDAKIEFVQNGRYKIRYLDFDYSLNDNSVSKTVDIQ